MSMAASCNWSELGCELLEKIARRINMYEDFISFSGVCKAWKSVAVLENFRCKYSQIPWLMFPPRKHEERDQDFVSCFFSLSKGMSRHVVLPDFDSAKYYPSRGWLIKFDRDLSVSLVHPFSRVQLQLPNAGTIPDWEDESMVEFSFSISKCAVSADSQEVMIAYGSTWRLARAKPGDKAWTRINNAETAGFWEVVCHKDRFYAIQGYGEIFAIDGDIGRPLSAPLPNGLRRHVHQCLYLVESDSDGVLWVVSRDGVTLRAVYPGNDDGNDEVLRYGTRGFQVFEINLGTSRWKEIKHLGNRSLFLGHNSSISLDVSNNPHCKPNCIYFTDDFCEGYWYMHEEENTGGGGEDMGVYNLEDGSIEPLYEGQYSYHLLNPPMWVEQSFL